MEINKIRLNADLTVNSDDLDEFQNRIGVQFKCTKHLIQALTHGTIFSGDKDKLDKFKKANNLEFDNYEKLEYLGDSVLGLIVTEYSYHEDVIDEYAKAQDRKIEGVLTAIKKVLVSNDNLKPVANKLNLKKYILCNLDNVTDVYDDVIEALIGAIYLEQQGYANAQKFVKKFFKINDALDKIEDSNPKGKLSEICDKKKRDLPEYKVLSEKGPAHKKIFIVGLYVCGKQVSIGNGDRIKDAEADAAEKYLNEMGSTSLK